MQTLSSFFSKFRRLNAFLFKPLVDPFFIEPKPSNLYEWNPFLACPLINRLLRDP